MLADRYRLLVELSPDAICVHQDGVLTYVAPAMVRLLRADSDQQMLGHHIREFVVTPSLRDLWKPVAGLTEQGMASEPAEVALTCLDGSPVLIESVSVRTDDPSPSRPRCSVVQGDNHDASFGGSEVLDSLVRDLWSEETQSMKSRLRDLHRIAC